MADNRSSRPLQCPRCGSTEVYEYRMGVHRYRINRDAEQFDRVMRESDETFFHRCANPACGYGSDSDIWDREGRSDFVPHEEERICK